MDAADSQTSVNPAIPTHETPASYGARNDGDMYRMLCTQFVQYQEVHERDLQRLHEGMDRIDSHIQEMEEAAERVEEGIYRAIERVKRLQERAAMQEAAMQ